MEEVLLIEFYWRRMKVHCTLHLGSSSPLLHGACLLQQVGTFMLSRKEFISQALWEQANKVGRNTTLSLKN